MSLSAHWFGKSALFSVVAVSLFGPAAQADKRPAGHGKPVSTRPVVPPVHGTRPAPVHKPVTRPNPRHRPKPPEKGSRSERDHHEGRWDDHRERHRDRDHERNWHRERERASWGRFWWWRSAPSADFNPYPSTGVAASPVYAAEPSAPEASGEVGRKSPRGRFAGEEDDDPPPPSRSARRPVRASVTAAEIGTGGPLNDVLDQLTGLRDPDSPALEPAVLERINVAPRGGSSLGVLKNDGLLEWPAVFRGTTFHTERSGLDALTQDAVRQARSGGRVDPVLLRKMGRAAADLEAKLKKGLPDLAPSAYIEGKRFLGQLSDAQEALQQTDVGRYFDHTYEARGRTVTQLVRYMSSRNLRFAPANPGSEQAYGKLYRTLSAAADRGQGATAEE